MTRCRLTATTANHHQGPEHRPERGRNSGFTLIEIMIVLAILTAVLALGAPRLFSSSSAMRTEVRKIAVMTREVRNIARLYNSTTRLALKMDDEDGHSYWVESASGNVTLLTEEQEEELARLTSTQREDEAPKNRFTLEERVTKKPLTLPKGLYFESIEFSTRENAPSAGTAYIHFFPQGLSEEAVIHLTDRKTLNWTIAINPLTGRADVYERKIMLKELRR